MRPAPGFPTFPASQYLPHSHTVSKPSCKLLSSSAPSPLPHFPHNEPWNYNLEGHAGRFGGTFRKVAVVISKFVEAL